MGARRVQAHRLTGKGAAGLVHNQGVRRIEVEGGLTDGRAGDEAQTIKPLALREREHAVRIKGKEDDQEVGHKDAQALLTGAERLLHPPAVRDVVDLDDQVQWLIGGVTQEGGGVLAPDLCWPLGASGLISPRSMQHMRS